MRICLIAIAVTGLPAGLCAQQRADTARPVPLAYIPHRAALPPSEQPAAKAPVSYSEYRIDPSFHSGRSAHSRALDEMNAINMRRPRPFRFQPVMALTFDAAQMDGPARMSGIAPNLMGGKRVR